MQDQEVLNSEETDQLLGVSAFTIREYAKAAIIPARKAGKQRFFKT